MLGLGETADELKEAMDDLVSNQVSILNLGQYLQPTRNHLPVRRYWTPEEFEELREMALSRGFDHCHAGPLVRSSYQAGEQYRNYRKNVHPLYRDNPELA
jgi:lipoic acid synthetase